MKLGPGTAYKTPHGQIIKHSDLPPEVQNAIEQVGTRRSMHGKPAAGEVPEGGSPDDTSAQTARIKRLYDPATRDNEMDKIATEHVTHALNARLAKRK